MSIEPDDAYLNARTAERNAAADVVEAIGRLRAAVSALEQWHASAAQHRIGQRTVSPSPLDGVPPWPSLDDAAAAIDRHRRLLAEMGHHYARAPEEWRKHLPGMLRP